MRAITWSALCAGLALAVLALAMPVSAITQNDCLARKLGDVGRTVAAAVTCSARDAATLSRCIDTLHLRFTGGDDPSRGLFAKRERKLPCPTVGDQDAIGLRIFTFADASVARWQLRARGASLRSMD